MTNKFIAALLTISVAACSSVPRIGPAQPANPAGAATSPSTGVEDDKTSESKPEQNTAESTQDRPDQTPPKRSHLTEIGKGIVLVTLIALMAWLQYRAVCPYSYC